MAFNDTLNTRNLYTDFGLVIQTGTADLLAFPERKKTLENDWREHNGKEYDLSLPRFKDKEINLKCAMMADTDVDFWTNYEALFLELSKPDWQNLFVADHGKTYTVFYLKTSNWRKKSKRLKDVDKVFVQFTLILQVQ
ncbi:hypothetical protein [Tenacibaculum aestuarii]|uniref:hypothetical protein n=1 Tax=Tenacibaculum aestuarii TaxID=362781 RepID=UPI003892F040